jgi:arylformamidase
MLLNSQPFIPKLRNLPSSMFLLFIVCFVFGANLSSAQQLSASGWLDVSVPIDPATLPVYTGNLPPSIEWVNSTKKGDKINLSNLHTGLHAGTHFDAPFHFLADGVTAEKVSLDHFLGPALVIECSPSATVIDAAELKKHKWQGAKRILFKTRNSYQNFWADKKFHQDFTALGTDAAQMLADGGVETVGIDYHSIQIYGTDGSTHRALLRKGVGVIEGLDLRKISGGQYEMMGLPIKLVGTEAAPMRVLLRPMK